MQYIENSSFSRAKRKLVSFSHAGEDLFLISAITCCTRKKTKKIEFYFTQWAWTCRYKHPTCFINNRCHLVPKLRLPAASRQPMHLRQQNPTRSRVSRLQTNICQINFLVVYFQWNNSNHWWRYCWSDTTENGRPSLSAVWPPRGCVLPVSVKTSWGEPYSHFPTGSLVLYVYIFISLAGRNATLLRLHTINLHTSLDRINRVRPSFNKVYSIDTLWIDCILTSTLNNSS